MIEMMKIHLHPKDVAMAPPTNEANPDPPQEPIDQKLRARWRSAPSKYALINAMVDGIIAAPENPVKIRPIMSNTAPLAKTRQSEPMILKIKPILPFFYDQLYRQVHQQQR